MTHFLASLRACFRDDQIVTSGEAFAFLAKDPVVNAQPPVAFVYPDSSEQIQILLKLATHHGTKLWVYSGGKNWGYLNTSGSRASVVVLLTRMHKILHVDAELAYAVLEPGVTYEQLNRYLQEHQIPLWVDSAGGPPSGSVLGNALDRGVGVTPYSDHIGNVCGLEVILADGTVVQTGAVPPQDGRSTAHLYKWGVGPSLDGLFSQSNFGVVVKAGIWLMRKPADYALISLQLADEAQLSQTMDTVRELMLSGVVPPTGRFSNALSMLTLLTQARDEGLDPQIAVSTAQLTALQAKYAVPSWTGTFAIYGQRPVVRAASRFAQRALRRAGGYTRMTVLPRARLALWCRWVRTLQTVKAPWAVSLIDRVVRGLLGSSLALVKLLPGIMDLHEGRPSETVVKRAYFRARTPRPDRDIHVGRDDIGIMWAVPMLPFVGRDVVAFHVECRRLFADFNFDYFMTVVVFNARSVCCLMAILYDRLDPGECARAERLYGALMELSHRNGYQYFRSGINGWARLYESCPELKALNQRLKRAFDPEDVLAPGRYGID